MRKMKTAIYKWITFVAMLGLLAPLGGCEENFVGRRYDTDEEYMQIYDYIKTRPDLSVYKAISDYSGFYSQISTAGTYTVFAAADTAWPKLYSELRITDYKEKTPEYWLMYMKYAALELPVNTNSFDGGNMSTYTMLDKNYYLSVDISSYTALKLNNSAIIRENNIELKNGYLNIIDGVLVPPITPVYDLLREDGKYEVMLSLFEEYGLKSYLTDSLVTVFVETDATLENEDFDPRRDMTDEEITDWLKYHIFHGQRYFTNALDKKMIQPLYGQDVVTFNVKTATGEGKGALFLNRAFRVSSNADRNALNGVVHEMFNVLRITDHTSGTIQTNLYGGTNPKKGYTKNVFAEAPAMVAENTGFASYHQRILNEPQPPICGFSSMQAGDAFTIRIPDVAKGVYTVRLIYNNAITPTLRLVFQDRTITSGIDMGKQDGDFTEYTTLKYKDCGSIEVNERGEIELKFIMDQNSSLLMDRLDLIPTLAF